MVIFKQAQDVTAYLSTLKVKNQRIGFVPTMGALHKGHRFLVESAKSGSDVVVCSIFINPTQFNDKADFEQYPVTLDKDVQMLIEAGCDVLFLPSVQEMYPDGTDAIKAYDFGYLDSILEGAHRPGHFKGVGQIVGRLLEIVSPNLLYLGQKDYQQCMVIKKLLELTGRDQDTEIVICSTQREADGLAMSSRNLRLTEPQRALAGVIYQCLISIQGKQQSDEFQLVQRECLDLLRDKGFEPEYVMLADAGDLNPLANYNADKKMVALIAAKIGNVRLIDNLVINP